MRMQPVCQWVCCREWRIVSDCVCGLVYQLGWFLTKDMYQNQCKQKHNYRIKTYRYNAGLKAGL